MTRFYLVWIMLAITAFAYGANGDEIKTFTIDETTRPARELPAGVTVDVDAGALRIHYDGNQPVSVVLFELPSPIQGPAVLVATARLRAENVQAPAYLEMLCRFSGPDEFFSRALNQTITGTVDSRICRTPFFLKQGEDPALATLGIRMEGPGTIWLDQAGMSRGTSAQWGGGHGIIGSILGLSFGIWGAMVGFAAPKGRGRRLALVSGVVLEGITLALFGWGLLLMARGEPQTAWYSYILYGIIGGVVGIPLLAIVRRAYSASEMRMMQAQDASENLGEH